MRGAGLALLRVEETRAASAGAPLGDNALSPAGFDACPSHLFAAVDALAIPSSIKMVLPRADARESGLLPCLPLVSGGSWDRDLVKTRAETARPLVRNT